MISEHHGTTTTMLYSRYSVFRFETLTFTPPNIHIVVVVNFC